MDLYVNTVVKNNKTGEIGRVLYINLKENYIVLINIEDNNWNYCEDYNNFIDSINLKERQIVEHISNLNTISESQLTKVEKEKRDKAYKIVEELYKITGEPDIFVKKIRNKKIKVICYKFKVSRNTVDTYLKRFWKNGMTKNAVLPCYYLCGGRGKEKRAGSEKRGKPSKYNTNKGINVDENIKKIFKSAINKFYHSNTQNTLKVAYNLMLNEYFTYKKVNNEGKIEILMNEEIPTLAQFRYWFQKNRNIKKEITSRFGNRVYQQKYRPIVSTVRNNIVGPGQLYQVDLTVGDIYLISEFDNKIIGRPNIIFVVDTFSYAIVGVNVTLDNPSWITASGALINTMSDKVVFCKEFGIDITEEMWSMKHMPNEILSDRGSEWLSKSSDNLINIGVNISNTSSYRPELKSIIEQSFRLFNLKTKSLLPGSVNHDFKQRGSKNYILDATLNIRDYTKIVIKFILNHNAKVLSSYSKDIEMIKDEVPPIPNELWKYGIENITGSLRNINKIELELALLPREEATVTEKGIRFRGIYYYTLKAIEERWFESARINGKYKIQVAYNSNNLSQIYVIDNRSYEKAYILSKDKKYEDKSIAEVEYINEKEKLELVALKRNEIIRDITLINDINLIVEEAQKRLSGISFGNKDIKCIRENRKIEKELIKNTKYRPKIEITMNDNEDDNTLELIKSLTKRRDLND